MMFALKIICTWVLFAASCSAVWWSFRTEKLISISWLAFLLPAVFQFVTAFWIGPSRVKSLIVFGFINLVFAALVGAGVWYLVQIANSYRSGR
ncbi:hypothetical protein [Paenibacillus amylolyticus]|uniref:Uncharacterized protein n=1 Tax=Paenibacillus amylolyticus TaxID=1451 RepID=A0A100VQR0_PAEAM|nr:hypothetical protein [Paenibacillus amylolyticus]GAS84101.1 unknown protein [Paenibacillus amylolyticus]